MNRHGIPALFLPGAGPLRVYLESAALLREPFGHAPPTRRWTSGLATMAKAGNWMTCTVDMLVLTASPN